MCSSSTSNSGSRFSPSGFSPLAGSVVLAMPARPDAYSVGSPSASSAAFCASSSRSEATSSSRSWLSETTSAMRASGRSVLLTTRITGRCAASALRSTKRVCGSGPSEASTSSSTPSTMDSPRSTSPPKSAWPGVSMTLMTVMLPSGWWRCTAVFFARMVMPFSFSRSPESIRRSTASSPRCVSAPDCRSMASTSVVLPWSTWATMATLRNWVIHAGDCRSAGARSRKRGHPAMWGVPRRWASAARNRTGSTSAPARLDLGNEAAASSWYGVPFRYPPGGGCNDGL